jgi:hypothetical protein
MIYPIYFDRPLETLVSTERKIANLDVRVRFPVPWFSPYLAQRAKVANAEGIIDRYMPWICFHGPLKVGILKATTDA